MQLHAAAGGGQGWDGPYEGGGPSQAAAKPQRRRKQVERGAPRLHTAERAESRTREPPQPEPDAGARREARRAEEARGRELAGAGKMRLTAEERQMRQLANLIDVLRQAMAHGNRKLYGKTVRDWAGVFKLIDRDGSGSVSKAEFKTAMRRMGLGLSDLQVEELMLLLDPEGSGEIQFQELQRVLAINWGASSGAPAGAFGTPRAADGSQRKQMSQRQAADRARADVANMMHTLEEEAEECDEEGDDDEQYADTRRGGGWGADEGEKMV